MMKKAFVHFAKGFEETEAITIVDVLRRAKIDTLMVSVTGEYEVEGAHGVRIRTDILFEDADYEQAEILILPGGMPGATNLQAHKGLADKLRAFHEKDMKLAAICAAPLVLGNLNILQGKEAVCYPGFEPELKGAKISYVPAIKSGNVLTGRGVGAALNFSLELVEELKGKELADNLAEAMLVQTW